MDAKHIELLIKGLGQTYLNLFDSGWVGSNPLTPLFDSMDNEDLVQEDSPGIELWYSAATTQLEKIQIILHQTIGQPIYSGDLPAPLTRNMTRESVRALFGTPFESRKPAKLPGGLGMRGGFDSYCFDPKKYPGVKITIGYLADLSANIIAFAMLDKGSS